MYIFLNVYLAKIAFLRNLLFSRVYLCQNLHLDETTFPRKLAFQKLHLPEFTFGRNFMIDGNVLHYTKPVMGAAALLVSRLFR